MKSILQTSSGAGSLCPHWTRIITSFKKATFQAMKKKAVNHSLIEGPSYPNKKPPSSKICPRTCSRRTWRKITATPRRRTILSSHFHLRSSLRNSPSIGRSRIRLWWTLEDSQQLRICLSPRRSLQQMKFKICSPPIRCRSSRSSTSLPSTGACPRTKSMTKTFPCKVLSLSISSRPRSLKEKLGSINESNMSNSVMKYLFNFMSVWTI